MIELAQIVAGWPLVLSMAAAVAAQGLRAGRRRSALNEALHELRRPLQAVALAAGPAARRRRRQARTPIELAAAALERLDREINGGPLAPALGRGRRPARWPARRWRAGRRGRGLPDGSLELRWNAGRAIVSGDRSALAQALDNLIVNAIEHGGPTIVVAAPAARGAAADRGRRLRPRHAAALAPQQPRPR